MAISHTACTHLRTPAGRRACRAGNTAPAVDYIATHIQKVVANSKIKARMDREYDARIQPRRSGARVSIDTSGCVQAALHIDAHGGRCACGWTATKVA